MTVKLTGRNNCWASGTEVYVCSETTLTGESRFHISTPLGIEPGSLLTRYKRVAHWTSETWYECSEIAGSPQGSSQQPTMSVVKPEGGSTARVKLGQKSCEIKWDYHFVGMTV
jgi:hypothetical protein